MPVAKTNYKKKTTIIRIRRIKKDPWKIFRFWKIELIDGHFICISMSKMFRVPYNDSSREPVALMAYTDGSQLKKLNKG